MMHPAFVQRSSCASFTPMERGLSNKMQHVYEQYTQEQRNAMQLPSMEESIAEFRMAQLIFQARIRAQARMSNFFEQQCRPQSSPNMVGLPPQSAQHCARPTQGQNVLRRTSYSVLSDDSSEASERQLLNDKSETSSLGSSSQSASPPQRKLYIDTIRDTDILCGRGGRSNHHPGNKRYRHVISEMKLTYKSTEAKSNKTDLSRAIVDHVCRYGGRFIKKEETSGRYYVLTRGEARKKTSQALRESKTLKWTN